MTTVFMETDRLWFRPPEQADAELVQGWLNDPEVRRHLLRRYPTSLVAEQEWIKNASVSATDRAPSQVPLLFGVKRSNKPIGSASLFDINWVSRDTEWGILIGDKGSWNNGYGREVAGAFVRYAFEELNLNRVRLRVNATNVGGVKAYEAAGFVREGVLRQAAYVDGEYVDMIAMAVLRDDWQKKSDNPPGSEHPTS